MKKCKWIIALLIAVTAISCNNNKSNQQNAEQSSADSIEDTSVESMTALYFNQLFLDKAMISWQKVKLDIPTFEGKKNFGTLDATIDNPQVVDEIQQLVKTLKPEPDGEDYICDTRVALTIRYKNGKEDHLAIANYEVDKIYLNGVLQQPNNRLLYVIKNNIGLYPWLIGDKLSLMPELQDTTFVKEPFISSEYYKIWEKKCNEQN